MHITNVSIYKGHFNICDPTETQIEIDFYTSNGQCYYCTLPFEHAEHLLGWDGDNPVDLLREVIELDKKAYWYSCNREKLIKLLGQCELHENLIEAEWLKIKREKLRQGAPEARIQAKGRYSGCSS